MATITINDYQGGIAQNPESTVANQFAMGQGLDITTPHILTVNQKLKAVGSIALLKAVTVGLRSYGIGVSPNFYPGFTSSNVLYKRTSETSTTWGLYHTYFTSPPLHNLESFGDYALPVSTGKIYKSYLPFSGTESNSYTGETLSADANSVVYPNTPIYNDGVYIYIGSSTKLDKYDLTTLSKDILELGDAYLITDITGDGNFIVLLSKPISGGSPDRIYWWDGFSEHYNHKLDLPFTADCLGMVDNIIIVFGDQDGSIYQVTPTGWSKVVDSTLLRIGNTPDQRSNVKASGSGNYTGLQGIRNVPAVKATTNFKNKLLYGQQDGDSLYKGIWSVGRIGNHIAVNYEWEIDGDIYSINNRYLTPNTPPNIYVCCASGTYKVLDIDYSNKITNAYYESLILDGGAPTITKRFDRITLETKPLPASCSILIKKKINGESSWATIGTYSGTGRIKQNFTIPNSNIGENIQIRFDFTVSSNNAPEVKSYSIDYAPIRK